MVYLIGVDHLVQYKGPIPEAIRLEFRSYLEQKCRELYITTIAEEFSDYALQEVYQATEETAREAARLLGIRHRYCDPGGEDLVQLGIPGFGEILEETRIKFNMPPSYILDADLRNKVRACAVGRAKSYWSIREQYWLDTLSDILGTDILFICGHEHVERFMSLLKDNGHQCSIIEGFWKEELFTDYGNLGL